MNRFQQVIRTERIWLKPHPQLQYYCHITKNLYNEANYLVRQDFFNQKKWIKVEELKQLLERSANYQELPLTAAQKVLQLVEQAWKAFFRSSEDYNHHPEKYFKKPSPPKYKNKKGEFLLSLKKHDFEFTNGIIKPQFISELTVKTRLPDTTPILGIRIIPKGVGYVFEILYLKQVPVPSNQIPKRIAGIDIGLTNLITMVNNIDMQPIVVKGGVVKSINQYYNKEQGRLQSIYYQQGFYTSKKLAGLRVKRERKLQNYFHKVSHLIIKWCEEQKIDTIVIGYNKQWKTHTELGKRTNQNFTNIPFTSLLQKLEYKAQDVGIRVIKIAEHYTSKCSFLDREPIKKHSTYLGERVNRGLFQTQTGTIINSDANGAYNIVKKAIPNAFATWEVADGIEGVWLHPIRWTSAGQPAVS